MHCQTNDCPYQFIPRGLIDTDRFGRVRTPELDDTFALIERRNDNALHGFTRAFEHQKYILLHKKTAEIQAARMICLRTMVVQQLRLIARTAFVDARHDCVQLLLIVENLAVLLLK